MKRKRTQYGASPSKSSDTPSLKIHLSIAPILSIVQFLLISSDIIASSFSLFYFINNRPRGGSSRIDFFSHGAVSSSLEGLEFDTLFLYFYMQFQKVYLQSLIFLQLHLHIQA